MKTYPKFSGDELKRRIEEKEITMNRFQALLELDTPSTLRPSGSLVYAWINNSSNPTADYLPHIARLLGCDISDFYKESADND